MGISKLQMQVPVTGTMCPDKWASPISMLRPLQMFYGSLLHFGKRSSSVSRPLLS